MVKKKNTFWNNGWTIAIGAVILGFILSVIKDLITKEPFLTTLKSITVYTSAEPKKTISIDSSKLSKPNPGTSPLEQHVDILNNKPLRIKHQKYSPLIAKGDTPKSNRKKDTSKNSGQFDLSHATFTAPTQIGNDNKQYNYSETHLEETDKPFIVQGIMHLKQQLHITNDTIIIIKTLNSNGAVYDYELSKFLINKGFIVYHPNGIKVSKEPINNVIATQDDGKIEFIIGNMVHK